VSCYGYLVNKCLFAYLLAILFGMCLEVRLLDHMMTLCLFSWDIPTVFQPCGVCPHSHWGELRFKQVRGLTQECRPWGKARATDTHPRCLWLNEQQPSTASGERPGKKDPGALTWQRYKCRSHLNRVGREPIWSRRKEWETQGSRKQKIGTVRKKEARREGKGRAAHGYSQ
jgi:hypothetical protein